MAAKKKYTAITEAGYGYTEGSMALGEVRALTEAEAERGLASGALARTPEASKNSKEETS